MTARATACQWRRWRWRLFRLQSLRPFYLSRPGPGSALATRRQAWRQMRRGGIAGTTYNLRLWPHKCQSLHKVRESSDDVGQAIDRMTC